MVRFLASLTAFLGSTGSPTPDAQDCTGTNAISMKCASAEVPYKRDFFYVGGHSVKAASGNITVDQIYVEKLTPVERITQKNPLVFFHGGGLSGSTWLNTPDGREGWASYFIKKGYVVYLVDNNSIGRSSENDIASYPMSSGSASETVMKFFTSPENYDTYPQAKFHTQWPGTGADGDPVYDQFKKSLIPLTTNFVGQENALRAAGCEMLSLLGEKAYLISHSLGSRNPLLLSNDCPEYIAGSINLEAATSPFWSYAEGLGGFAASPWGLTNTPVTYDPPVKDPSELKHKSVGNETLAHRNCYLQVEPARKLPQINKVPYLLLTGEASIHITYDHCAIDFLKQAGGKPEWIKLADWGIKGNGHFLHVEKNNLQIAGLVDAWIRGRLIKSKLGI
ncbi:fusarubin cluster-esterase [Fusarium sporotrichioides]|uniref:Fusarubin cluster-esterase n=1 Tax=Fusarium sporotrichioides TaxID=5514 RepID=A0A395RFQ2_FUSSP|nr:fusarubin cluster-esterase [Fusarium sporotrichioides]